MVLICNNILELDVLGFTQNPVLLLEQILL